SHYNPAVSFVKTMNSIQNRRPISSRQPACRGSMISHNISLSNLQISQVLYDFIEKEATPGTGVTPKHFWAALGRILKEMTPRNQALLHKRDELQAKIDEWHRT